MGLYQLAENALNPVRETTFQSERLLERRDLQSRLRDSIDIVAPDLMVISEEFGNWEDSRRRIDLLCVDRAARLVVVELKRTQDGGFMDLQAVRYAAMVSKMTFPAAVDAHRHFLQHLGRPSDVAEAAILDFLGWSEPRENDFAADVRLILVSAEFSRELMTSVMWLSERDLDITCIRFKPYRTAEAILLDVTQVFPLQEATDYQIRIREKEQCERRARQQNRELTRFDLTIGDREFKQLRKLRLAYHIVREAINRGAAPRQVIKANTAWIAVDGELDSATFLAREKVCRDADSSRIGAQCFFTANDELIHWQGKTYALRANMWGRSTRDQLDQIIRTFGLSDVRYVEAA